MNKADVSKLLASAKRPERTVVLCMRGDLQADWEDLDRKLIAARTQRVATLAGGTEEEAGFAAKIQELEAEMAENSITFRLRALPRRQFLELTQAHPPRAGDERDKSIGLNADTYYDALIGACLLEPELEQDELTEFLDLLTSRQFEELMEAAWNLNRGDVSVPFSYTASRTTRSSEGT